MHVITPITVLFEQHWMPHALHAGHTGGQFYALVMFQNRQLLHHSNFALFTQIRISYNDWFYYCTIWHHLQMVISINKFSIISLVNLWLSLSYLYKYEYWNHNSIFRLSCIHITPSCVQTGPCNCVELPAHLQHRICTRFSFSWMGFYH